MKILYAVSEAFPYLQECTEGDWTSGLADTLSNETDSEVAIFLPCYQSVKDNNSREMEFVTSFYVSLGWRSQYCGIFRAKNRSEKLQYYFIDNEYYFYRDHPCGYEDDCERFAFFSKAVLDALYYLDWYPDIIHCSNWQTGLIPVFLRAMYQQSREYRPIRTVLSILDIEHQGKVHSDFTYDVLGFSYDWFPTMQFDGCTNLMKGAILVSDRICTLSQSYAQELQRPFHACGLDDMIRQQAYKLSAIDTDPAHIGNKTAKEYYHLYCSMF